MDDAGIPSDERWRPLPADEEAARLSARFFERLQLFAARRLRDPGVAEEVAQETLRRAVEALRNGRIRNLDALPAFLFETARNICLHRLRATGREARALGRLEVPASDPAASPLDALITAQEIASVRKALEELPDDDRRLLVWSYHEGLDATEIGRRLDLTPGAVRVRRHRALGRLAVILRVTSGTDREHR